MVGEKKTTPSGVIIRDSSGVLQTVQPSTGGPAIVDDFEDGDMSEYSVSEGSLVSSPTYEGNYAYNIVTSGNQAISFTGLDNYPSRGDTFEVYIYFADDSDTDSGLFVFGAQQSNKSHNYAFEISNTNTSSPDFHLGKDVNLSTTTNGFSGTKVDDTDINFSQVKWYKVRVKWGSSDIVATIIDPSDGSTVSQLTLTDTTYDSGGIGYFVIETMYGSPDVYWDYIGIV